jgi:hypothetical protein
MQISIRQTVDDRSAMSNDDLRCVIFVWERSRKFELRGELFPRWILQPRSSQRFSTACWPVKIHNTLPSRASDTSGLLVLLGY